ncbi:MFS transporter [Catenuloplanes atrovinosus]|uniref:MFS family permease n=1 Tax=Catenuloplanes atrovinosus TaxID=137266 RepID=A0AAE3YM70_9ACTN|nr:MFS transporter [Catenuloplanes atrovinosus]MDR7274758.1 MFS family permease [Catenuloplanes atrovinosus]
MGFRAFWLAQTLSVAGDSFSLIAVPLLVLGATGSVAMMGLLTAAAGVATVVAGAVAGVVVDRVDRRRLLIGCDLARCVLLATVPLAWLLPEPPIHLLFAVLPACAAIGMFFQVAAVTAVRGLVGPDGVTRANGRIYASTALASVLGPALAGTVSAQLGPAAAIAADAATFAASAACLLAVRLAPVPASVRGRWRDEFSAGARFLLRHPVLRPLTALLTVFLLFTFGLTDVVIYRLKSGLDAPDAVVGLVLGAGAVGTALGALAVAPLRRRLGFGACWIGSTAMCAGAVLGLAVASSVPVVCALVTLYFASLSIGGICSMSLRQQVTPEHLLGRVTSAFWTIHFSLGPLGAAALTALAARFGTATAFTVAGAGTLALAATALTTPVRASRPERPA